VNYYLVAGERSGDLHGGNLIKALKQHDSSARFKGFGGDYMQEVGLDLSVHYRNMAFMGLLEFLFNLRKISRYIRQCKNEIGEFKPDVVILIDYAGFNRQIGKYCKKNGVRVFYYITPKVWAWRQNRAWALKETIDRMFVILPFEKDFFKKKVNWDVDYVGNPVLDAVKDFVTDKDFIQKNSLDTSKEIVALLPGSRKQELKYIVPAMAGVVAENPKIHFAVATVSNLSKSLYAPFQGLTNVSFVEEATYDLLSIAKAAVVTSGTATLEAALFNVPQVVVYKTSWFNYFIGKRVVRVPFISLVNLIANKEVVKELLQEQCTPHIISEELSNLLNNQEYRATVVNGNKQVYKTLDIGSASENTAKLMVKYLTSNP
jgi:lipid-A-disaccharide synthase